MPPGRPIRLTTDDVSLVADRMPELPAVIGESVSWRTAITYGRKTVNGRVLGTNTIYGGTRKHYPQAGGRFFTEADEAEKRRVLFLGDEMAKDIFGVEDPVGKTLLVNSSPFTVIGVMQHKTPMGVYGGPRPEPRRHSVDDVQGDLRSGPAERARDPVADTGRHGGGAGTPERDRGREVRLRPHGRAGALDLEHRQDVEERAADLAGHRDLPRDHRGADPFVGGIGVANIMYAVVRERTREIGVKMALGAKARWITWPFVLEGLVYTLVGGSAGLVIAVPHRHRPGPHSGRIESRARVPRPAHPVAAHRGRDGGDPRRDRPSRRVFPRAARRGHRPRRDAPVRVRRAENEGERMSRNARPLAPTDDIIVMDGIRKVYDTGKVKVEALKGVSFKVKKGEFVAIVGPSGSGKSTLMNLLGCLDTPTSGVYELGGEPVAGLSRDALADVRNRRVGFVFQNFNLLPQISAQENVEMPMLFGGIPPKARRARAAEVLSKVGLGDRLDHKPTELSGGQMQRVAVARALAMTPDMLLADEPTGNLDSASGGDIMGLFTELWSAGGTVIVITHDMTPREKGKPGHRGARRADPQGFRERSGLSRRAGSPTPTPACLTSRPRAS